jgi:hypothetical protein
VSSSARRANRRVARKSFVASCIVLPPDVNRLGRTRYGAYDAVMVVKTWVRASHHTVFLIAGPKPALSPVIWKQIP